MPSDWETIKEARKRIMDTGLSKGRAERDLCRAMAEGKIRVKVILDPPSPAQDKKPLDSLSIKVPPDLSRTDLDWTLSRPKDRSKIWIDRSPWPLETGLLYYNRVERPYFGWKVYRIDARSADVTQTFCNIDKPTDILAPTSKPKSVGGRGSKRRAVENEIARRWPKGIPDIIPTKEVAALILEELKIEVTPRHIQRILADHPRVPAE